jgi:acetyl esterase/lipase
VEYRRAHETGGGWPNTFQDAERGVAAVRESAAKYPLDVKRLVVLGHSAGGQLALYVASRLKAPAISLAGIVDMRAYAHTPWNPCVDGELLARGGPPEDHPDRYAKVSPAELLPLGVPQILIWGGRDEIVHEADFADYEKRADHVEIVKVPEASQHDFGTARGPAWEATLAAVARLTKSRER